MSKGQVFSPDFIGSIVIFTVVVSIFMMSWNSIAGNLTAPGTEETMRRTAYQTTTFLISTEGYPEDWNSSTVKIPGFAESDNVLNLTKLEEFDSLSFESQRELLKANEFYLAFQNESGNMTLDGNELVYGEYPESPDTAVVITRSVLINDSKNFKESQMMYVSYR